MFFESALKFWASFFVLYFINKRENKAESAMNIIVGNSNTFAPKISTKGLIIKPINIPAKDPPDAIILKILFACLGLNISPDKIQNCRISIEVIMSIVM